jgi:hypothetical protein
MPFMLLFSSIELVQWISECRDVRVSSETQTPTGAQPARGACLGAVTVTDAALPKRQFVVPQIHAAVKSTERDFCGADLVTSSRSRCSENDPIS